MNNLMTYIYCCWILYLIRWIIYDIYIIIKEKLTIYEMVYYKFYNDKYMRHSIGKLIAHPITVFVLFVNILYRLFCCFPKQLSRDIRSYIKLFFIKRLDGFKEDYKSLSKDALKEKYKLKKNDYIVLQQQMKKK